MGVCPQHDLLFPDLTAREMLRLFCALKGLPRAAWAAEIAGGLAAVNLADVADRRTATYSGGMKRRLSIALATLGSPALLLFDEPSTGLDPLARADLLQLIQSFKRTSGIVLTTHSMAEAAALGDRVAIMAQGRLVALGSTVELTRRYGKGYLVALTLASGTRADFEGVAAAVAAVAPAARLALRDGAAVTFTMPFAAVDAQLPALLEWCDAQVARAGAVLREFGVSGPSLEDAFMEVPRASKYALAEQTMAVDREEGAAGDGGAGGAGGAPGEYALLPGSDAAAAAAALPLARPPPRQYVALFTKHLTLLSRQRGLCLCQLLTPLIILGLLLVLEQIVATEVGLVSVFIIPPIYLPLNFYVDPPTSFGAGGGAAPAGQLGAGGAIGAADMVRMLSVFKAPARERRALLAGLNALPASAAQQQAAVAAYATDAPPSARRLQQYYSIGDATCVRFYLSAVQPLAGGAFATPAAIDALIASVGSLPQELTHNTSQLPAGANATGFLALIPLPHWCALHNHSLLSTPFFAPRYDAALALQDAQDGDERVARKIDDELL